MVPNYQPYQSTWNNPYLPLYNQGQQVQPQMYGQPVNGIIKVNGPQSAMQYQLPPNSTSPALFDASGKCFYVVSTDGTGTKSLEWFDFSPHEEAEPEPAKRYVTREEFDEAIAKISESLEAAHGTDGPTEPRPRVSARAAAK